MRAKLFFTAAFLAVLAVGCDDSDLHNAVAEGEARPEPQNIGPYTLLDGRVEGSFNNTEEFGGRATMLDGRSNSYSSEVDVVFEGSDLVYMARVSIDTSLTDPGLYPGVYLEDRPSVDSEIDIDGRACSGEVAYQWDDDASSNKNTINVVKNGDGSHRMYFDLDFRGDDAVTGYFDFIENESK